MQRTAIYTHTTSKQEAKNRVEEALDYLREEIGVGLDDDQSIHRDRIHRHLTDNTGTSVEIPTGVLDILARRDDTDHRDGRPAGKALTAIVEDGDPVPDHIIVPRMHRVAAEDIDAMSEHGADVHLLDTGVTVHANPGDGIDQPLLQSIKRLNGRRTDAEAIIDGIPHSGGRPPIGCRVQDGVLRPGDDYYRTCETLQAVADDELGKTDAATKLGCARKTIDNALQRPELYQLD